MRIARLSRCVLGISVAAALLAGCSGSPLAGAPGAPTQVTLAAKAGRGDTSTYTTIYRFKNIPQAAYPNAGLIAGLEVLYGTTNVGGEHNLGTVFLVTTGGREKILYEFQGGSDGEYPDATVTAMNGALYGTTNEGGASNYGVVFGINAAGRERVLHAFTGSSDGSYPYSGLLAYHGALYGTTSAGGAYGYGTAFEIEATGKFRLLYSFGATSVDGQTPYAGLIHVNGAFYGTTYYGGAYGEGTVFKLSSSGVETAIYSFGATSGDGANPRGELTYSNGTFYGTTLAGGTSGYGTVFAMTPSGGESVLHSFAGDPDGKNPFAAPIVWHGALYGTTYSGGNTGGCTKFLGCGTIFKVTLSGSETVLYNFQANPDGSGPWGGVTVLGRALYGAASTGGNGCGTIFMIRP